MWGSAGVLHSPVGLETIVSSHNSTVPGPHDRVWSTDSNLHSFRGASDGQGTTLLKLAFFTYIRKPPSRLSHTVVMGTH